MKIFKRLRRALQPLVLFLKKDSSGPNVAAAEPNLAVVGPIPNTGNPQCPSANKFADGRVNVSAPVPNCAPQLATAPQESTSGTLVGEGSLSSLNYGFQDSLDAGPAATLPATKDDSHIAITPITPKALVQIADILGASEALVAKLGIEEVEVANPNFDPETQEFGATVQRRGKRMRRTYGANDLWDNPGWFYILPKMPYGSSYRIPIVSRRSAILGYVYFRIKRRPDNDGHTIEIYEGNREMLPWGVLPFPQQQFDDTTLPLLLVDSIFEATSLYHHLLEAGQNAVILILNGALSRGSSAGGRYPYGGSNGSNQRPWNSEDSKALIQRARRMGIPFSPGANPGPDDEVDDFFGPRPVYVVCPPNWSQQPLLNHSMLLMQQLAVLRDLFVEEKSLPALVTLPAPIYDCIPYDLVRSFAEAEVWADLVEDDDPPSSIHFSY